MKCSPKPVAQNRTVRVDKIKDMSEKAVAKCGTGQSFGCTIMLNSQKLIHKTMNVDSVTTKLWMKFEITARRVNL